MKASRQAAVRARFDTYFSKIHRKHRNVSLQVLIASDKLDFQYTYAPDEFNRPFHIASIGKLFTAALVMILAEKQQLTIQDPIATHFSKAELDKLFVYQGTDYAHHVTIEQLLAHTSGIGDYFDDPVRTGTPISKRLVTEPNKHWTPHELLDFTRTHQQAVGIPGQTFHYSDTGYILLGLLIEKVTGTPFHDTLHAEIFTPLGMDDSYLFFYSEPKNPRTPFQKIWFDGTDVTDNPSLSVDWAGGGIISTPHDLLAFYKALQTDRLFSSDKRQLMATCTNKMRTGIHYGVGMMELRFGEFFFLLKGLPRVQGHLGVLATHLFYDPTTETYIILNFGSNNMMVQSFKALIEIVARIKKLASRTK